MTGDYVLRNLGVHGLIFAGIMTNHASLTGVTA